MNMDMSDSRIKTRILIISDTHAALPCSSTSSKEYAFREPLPAADVAIHCGDLTMTGKIEEHERALELLQSLQAEVKIVIPGNHDLTLDSDYCRSHPLLYSWDQPHTVQELAEAHNLYTNDAAAASGIFYLVEGTNIFKLSNGGSLAVYATAYTPEFMDWAFPYERTEDRFNRADISSFVPDHVPPLQDGHVDIVVSHGPPKFVLDKTERGEHVGCEHLAKAISRSKPLLHCFGHIHEGWGAQIRTWQHEAPHKYADHRVEAERTEKVAYIDATQIQAGSQCLFVNAAIMDISYLPSQSPWLVDLLLPKTSKDTLPTEAMANSSEQI